MFARLVVLLAVLAVACAFRANMQMKSGYSYYSYFNNFHIFINKKCYYL